jgi:tetratricopeptide (TPR) repeat protein
MDDPEVWSNARAAAERAIRLDSASAEGWAALADYQTYNGQDWQAAERAFRRANELNPSLANNHYHYAWYLALFGRVDEALVAHRRSAELDPLNPRNTVWIPALYWWSRDYERAYAEAKEMLEDYPDNLTANGVFGGSALRLGLYDEAIAHYEKVRARFPSVPRSILAEIYAQAGRREEALRIVREMEAESSPDAGVLFGIYADLGDREEALRWLEYAASGWAFPWVWANPSVDALRSDPRFPAAFRRMNLRFEPGRLAPVAIPVVDPSAAETSEPDSQSEPDG